MKLFMHDPGGSGHPLHVAGTDPPAAAGRIPVFDFPLIDDSHGLEAAMRVFADSEAFVRRREFHRAGIIEEQERTQFRPLVRVSKERPHGEPVAHPVTLRTALDAPELLHRLFFGYWLHCSSLITIG